MEGLLKLIRVIWKAMPSRVRDLVRRVYELMRLARADRHALGSNPDDKIVIAGMFRTASGLGTWARSNYHCLVAAGYDVVAVDLSEFLAPLDHHCDIPLQAFPKDRTGTLIIHANAPEIPYCLRVLGLTRGRQWRVVAAWAWELQQFPKGWERAFPMVSEIWALSEFAAAAFRSHPKAPPVRVAPIAISAPATEALTSTRDNTRFRVLVMADSFSSLARKNPLGAIEAFQLAFGAREDCQLIVKIRNLSDDTDEGAVIRSIVSTAGNIDLIDQSLSDTELWQLMTSANAVLSLHRAEGFGLALAEAMCVGVPTIATGWSGNLSFSDQASAALIPYDLVPVVDPSATYTALGAVWAEPDIAAAADALAMLEADEQYAKDLASRGRAHVETTCSPARIQNLLSTYLIDPAR